MNDARFSAEYISSEQHKMRQEHRAAAEALTAEPGVSHTRRGTLTKAKAEARREFQATKASQATPAPIVVEETVPDTPASTEAAKPFISYPMRIGILGVIVVVLFVLWVRQRRSS